MRPRPRRLDLRGEREQRRLVVGLPTSWTASGRPVAENPAGTDAAGWPVEFHRTLNGTQPVSHR